MEEVHSYSFRRILKYIDVLLGKKRNFFLSGIG